MVGRPTRGPSCAPSVRIRGDATAHGLSTGAARQAEINQHSREFAMRQMSDNVRLSDTVAKQIAGTRQREGRKGAAAPLTIISARGPMQCGHGQQRYYPTSRAGADHTVPVRRSDICEAAPTKDPIGSTCSTRSPAQAGSQSHKHSGFEAGGFQTAIGFWPITRRLRLIARKYSIPSAAIASPTIASPSASSTSVSSQAA